MKRGGPRIWLTKQGKSPYWVIRYVDPDTGQIQQKSTGTIKKKDAERFLGEFRSELANGRYEGTNKTSWSTFREKYEQEVLPGLAPKTVDKVATTLNLVEEILKPQKLADLTPSRLSKLAAELRSGGRAENTTKGYLAHLRSALSWAVSIKLLPAVPTFPKLKRARALKKPKGRAPTEAEFDQIMKAVPAVVGEDRAPSWQHFLWGLWWSGLRLGEALELWWDRQDRLCIDTSGQRLALRIPGDLEKGNQDRLLPLAPEFVEFLLRTPAEEQRGRVFKPEPDRVHGERLTLDRVSRVITMFGEKAGVVVNVNARDGKVKHASAHDFRRAFGDRWALRVMPPVLMQLMRHESIETTMRFYVGRSVEATNDVLWDAYRKATYPGATSGNGKRETSRETGDNRPENADRTDKESPGRKPTSDQDEE